MEESDERGGFTIQLENRIDGTAESDRSSLNEVFDAIYCINLGRRCDRWEACQDQFSRLQIDVERQEAIDGNPGIRTACPSGHVGCVLSHLGVYRRALEENHERILVLEDDVEFVDHIKTTFPWFWRQVPDDWEVVYFGWTMSKKYLRSTRRISDNVIRIRKAWQTHAVALTRACMEDLVDLLPRARKPIDHYYQDVTGRWIKPRIAYAFAPKLVYQRQGVSDINGSVRARR